MREGEKEVVLTGKVREEGGGGGDERRRKEREEEDGEEGGIGEMGEKVCKAFSEAVPSLVNFTSHPSGLARGDRSPVAAVLRDHSPSLSSGESETSSTASESAAVKASPPPFSVGDKVQYTYTPI